MPHRTDGDEERPVYVVPAARALAVVHVQDPARPVTLDAPVARGRRVPEWPKETVLGWTLCDMPMYAEGLWVAFGYDPDRDGEGLLCSGCGGPPRAEEIAMF